MGTTMRGRAAALVLIVALAGCGGGEGEKEVATPPEVESGESPGTTAAGTQATPPEDSEAKPRVIDPCTLVPVAEAEALVGPPLKPLNRMDGNGAVGTQSDCTYKGGGFVQSAPNFTVATRPVKGTVWPTYTRAMGRIYELTEVPDLGGAAVRWEDEKHEVIGVGWWNDGTIVSLTMHHVGTDAAPVRATVDQLLTLAGEIDARL
jgi:hypothetical protein